MLKVCLKKSVASLVFGFIAAVCWSDEPAALLITLAEAQARTLEASASLRTQRLQLLAEEYALRLGWRAFFPTLSIGFNQADAVALHSSSDTSKKTVSLSLHQPLFDGGRTLFQRKTRRLALALSEHDYLTKKEALLDQTQNLFFSILLFREKMRLQMELKVLARQQLTISARERELGAITEIDYIDTELENKKLDAEIRKTAMEEEALVYQFQMLCGLPRTQAVECDGKIDFTYPGAAFSEDPRYWLGVALDRNADLHRLRFEAEKSREEYRLARTTFIPTIGADFTFSLAGEGFPLYEPGFSLKLTFQFPFPEAPARFNFDAASNLISQRTTAAGFTADILPDLNYLADERLALLNIRMLSLELENAEEDLRFSIEQFLKNHSYETLSLALQKETLTLLDRKQRVIKEQLGIGEIKRLDYLKAQNEFYRQEISIRENILRIIQMERSFEKLLGLEAGELSLFTREKNQ